MKTKLSLIIIGLFLACSSLSAQEYKQEADLIKSLIGKAKKDFVTNIVSVPADKSEAFWKYYNAYETQRQHLGERRLGLIMKYADLYGSSDAKANKNLISEVLSLRKKNEKNLNKYFKKINKQVDTKTAMQFFQVEEFLRSSIENEVLRNLPLNK